MTNADIRTFIFRRKWPLSGQFVDVIVGASLIVSVVVMVAPIAPWVMDGLLGFNLGGAVVLVSLALMLKQPLRFSVLPTLLLVSTLLRLGLNVASTRLILTRADAGQIISGFGSTVVGGDIVVGLVIFCIVALVLFLVITKGAERVAEVAARFSLDALPGLQVAIDAEVRGGAITAHEAGQRRAELDRQSRYFGALDGAMKFVRGDAVATMIILAINLVGGVAVGTLRHGMGLSSSLELYGSLTVGDGLVTLLPALLTSTAAGLLVTRVGQGDEGLRPGAQLEQTLRAEPRALLFAGLLLWLLAAVPGLPAWPFLLVGAALLVGFFGARRGSERGHSSESRAICVVRLGSALAARHDAVLLARRTVEVVRERIGPLLEDSDLMVASGEGLSQAELVLELWGNTVRAHIEGQDERLCLARPLALRRIGLPIARPLAGGYLLSRPDAAIAIAAGLEVVSDDDFLVTVISSWLCERAAVLSTVESTGRIVEELSNRSPRLVREVVPRRIGLPALSRLLGELAEEGLGAQHALRILEAIAHEPGELDQDLAQRVRQRLKEIITAEHAGKSHSVETLTLGPQTESALFSSLRRGAQESRLALSPLLTQDLCSAVDRVCGDATAPVLLVSSPLRRPLRELLHHAQSAVKVLAHGELEPHVAVHHLGTVEL
ncbi:MAG: flagellar biosynthesis protein FlhA [Myxococcota bacterium]|jgi:flagellar biosynthesis component FlhA|nr:flagellar biosynthesis protein FlhA [Myxococcota bacterium]